MSAPAGSAARLGRSQTRPDDGSDKGLDSMTNNRVGRRMGVTGLTTGTTLLAVGLAMAGCSKPEIGPAASRLRVYAADMTGGAKTCDTPNVIIVAKATAEATMKVVNDGGWCGLPVHQDGPKPFDAGLLAARPAHGDVTIHEVGDNTRIDYTPDRGFAGTDSFSVKLIPSDAIIHVSVTVAAPSAKG